MNLLKLVNVTTLSLLMMASFNQTWALANGSSANSNGEITFEPDEDGITDPPIIEPPVTPEPPITTGALRIDRIPTSMNFGTQVIESRTQFHSMLPEERTHLETGERVPYVSYVRVVDHRGNFAGWDLNVSLSNFIGNDEENSLLRGAQLHFLASDFDYVGQEGNEPTYEDSFIVPTPGESTEVATLPPFMSANEGQGAGMSTVILGDQGQIMETGYNDSIRLEVPGAGTSMIRSGVTYIATMTWELSSTPDNRVE